MHSRNLFITSCCFFHSVTTSVSLRQLKRFLVVDQPKSRIHTFTLPSKNSTGWRTFVRHAGCHSHKYPAVGSTLTKWTLFREISSHVANQSMGDQKKQPVMKIESDAFRSLVTPELEYVAELFKKYNFELRLAGGAVRDLLMGKVPSDLDFATTAMPREMQDMFTKEQVRMLNKKGEKHGTITCRINDKENFEITTLRVDVSCDGRHAEVEFTTDWFKDASRRDLTVNAMFLDLDGGLYDYYGGVEDLDKRRIAFVGKAEERICEDFLRILRYFRFYGRLAQSPDGHQPDTLEAIKRTAPGLEGISGERLWVELKKIVLGRYAGPIMRRMVECGVARYLGLPSVLHLDEFERLVELTADMDPKPMTVISALLEDESDVHALDRRCKMSAAERLLGLYIVNGRYDGAEEDDTKAVKRFKDTILQEVFRPSPGSNASERIFELLKYQGRRDLLETLRQWSLTKPSFPINGDVLMSKAGLKPGKRLKEALDHLFEYWKLHDYACNEEALLSELERWRNEKRSSGDRTPSPPSQKKKGKTAPP